VGGVVRWLASDLPAATLRDTTKTAGGHATLFRGNAPADGVFTPLRRDAGPASRPQAALRSEWNFQPRPPLSGF